MLKDTIEVEVSYRGWRSLWRWTTRTVEVPVPAEMRAAAERYHSRTGWGV